MQAPPDASVDLWGSGNYAWVPPRVQSPAGRSAGGFRIRGHRNPARPAPRKPMQDAPGTAFPSRPALWRAALAGPFLFGFAAVAPSRPGGISILGRTTPGEGGRPLLRVRDRTTLRENHR